VQQSIKIINHSSIDSNELTRMIKTVHTVFNQSEEILDSPLHLSEAFDNSRQQYNSTALLAQILQLPFSKNEKAIAIVDVDLYIPILTFVFGEAQLEGHAAIVSIKRLINQFYGLPPNDEILISRLEKEVIHELGHTFGLLHCRQFECVMRSSTYVEEIDLKRVDLCNSCKKILKEKINI
jgi:archaemetzincin